MKKYLLLISVLLVTTLNAQSGFTINGKIAGLKEGEEVKLIAGMDGSGNLLASAKVSNGVFHLKGKLLDAEVAQLSFKSSREVLDIFIGNESLSISGDLQNLANCQIVGSQLESDYQQFKKTFTPYFERLQAIVTLINPEKSQVKRDSLIRVYLSTKDEFVASASKFMIANASSPISGLTLYALVPLIENVNELEKKFELIEPKGKKSIFGRELAQKIADNKVGAVGTKAIDFVQNDVKGKPVSLASYRGKYVLVDFWASWCGPCRAENPNVVEAYRNFKNKNFTILGVSLDQDKNKWINAIAEDQLDWVQVSDLKYWNNEVAQKYKIQSIPANILVDPNGMIVAKNIRGAELIAVLTKLLK